MSQAKQPATDKILDKIRKLLNVGNDSRGNEQERETAMRQALKMLAIHNLEMKDVQNMDDKEDRDEVHYEEFPDPFRKVIANAIAQLYFCRFYPTKVQGKQKTFFHFVGLESNCNAAKEVAAFVIRSVYTESQRQQNSVGGGAHSYGTTFRNAAGMRIVERCEQMRKDEEKEQEATSTGTALVLASLYDQEEKANENFIEKVLDIKLKSKKHRLVNKNAKAHAEGREYGDKVNLASNRVGTDGKAAPVAGQLEK